MKEQDLIQALGSLPQDLLDELDEWQKSGAPLTGAEPENNAPARTGKPVITQRRNQTMKQKTEKTPARLRAWTAGIAAAVVLCTAVAVPVGREAVRRAQQSNAGFAESEPAEPVTEVSAETWIVPDGCTFFHWEDKSDLAGYYDCLPADTKLYAFLDELGEEQPPLEAGRLKPGNVRHFVYGEDDEVYDIYFIGLPMQEAPDNPEDLALIAGTLTQSGKLHLQIGALTDAEQAVRYFETEKRQYAQPNTAFVFAVPEGALPEITEVSTSYDEIPLEPFLTDAPEAESERLEWFVHLVEQNSWLITANGEPGIRLIADEPAEEILTAEQPDNSQSPDDAFYAWFWTGYSGNDIPLDGITVDVIRTAADGKSYLTESGQQDQSTLATVLSEEWLEQAYPESEAITDPVSGRQINSDGQPHDVIFIGIPADALPRNAVTQNYHSGTLTPSGKLHIDITALTFLDEAMPLLPEERQFDESLNRYFFITVPAGELPETIEPTVSITEYHTDLMPPESLATPQAVWDWYIQCPAGQSWLASVVGNKFIHRIPDEPETVPVQYAYSCLLTETERIETEPGKDAFCDYDSETGKIGLTLPVHNAAAAAALTDLHISADGVLSLTLNELCRSGSDLTQDTAYITWDLYVPKGSLPEITDIRLDRNTLSDEEAFMDIAGQLITVTKE